MAPGDEAIMTSMTDEFRSVRDRVFAMEGRAD